MMKNFKISTRLYFLVGLALAVFTAAAVYQLYDSHNSMVGERKAKLKAMNETVVTMLEYFKEQEASGALTTEEAQPRLWLRSAPCATRAMAISGSTTWRISC